MIIIGKGSKLYQSIKKGDVVELSTRDFFEKEFKAFDHQTIIVFSLLNVDAIDRLLKNSNGIILIIGSCAAISGLSKRFNYSKLKESQLNYVKKLNNTRLKYLTFGEFYPTQRKGLYFFSDVNYFWEFCEKALKSDKNILNFFSIEGKVSKFSNIFTIIEKFSAPFLTLVIKLFTNFTYGYSNAAFMRDEKKVAILGSGICAYAVNKIWKKADCFSEKSNKPHIKLDSRWRPDPIIANNGKGGLSMYYHGVTPTITINNKLNIIPLEIIKMNDRVPKNMTDSYFVPRFTPRPKIKTVKDINNFKESKSKDITYLCLSVIGNINFLIEKNYISRVQVSDDIVYKIGTVSEKSYNKLIKKNVITKKGSYFPIINLKNGHINFRPVFFKKISINFIDISNDLFRDLSFSSLIEKILRSLYMRFGFIFLKPKYWECYVQQNLKDAYTVTKEKIKENDVTEEINYFVKNAMNELIDQGFSDFKLDVGDFMSGIHLGYDRKILKKIPKKYRVFDTSLNDYPGSHPTIYSFCKSYNVAKSDYQSIYNDL